MTRRHLETSRAALCRATLAANSKSFSLASRLLPSEARDDAAAVYAWCRRVDDAVDGVPPSEQGAALDALERELDAIYAGRALDEPAPAAFAEVVAARRIPETYPRELLAGMRMDVEGVRYETMSDLLVYCYRAAGVVGLMMAHVLDVRDSSALGHAAHLGMAMQLTNIARDVREDFDLGRVYLPSELLDVHGATALRAACDRRDAFPLSARDPLRAAVRALLGEAEPYYRSGDRGLPALPWRAAVAIRAARLVYSAIGDEIARTSWDVLAGRAVVPTARKLRLALRAVVEGVVTAPARLASPGLASPRLASPDPSEPVATAIRYPHDALGG